MALPSTRTPNIDIAAVNPATGRRLPIDNGHLANIWPWETDNLYGLCVAGTQLWLRQNFRGAMDFLRSKRLAQFPDDDEFQRLRDLGQRVQ